MSMRFYNINGMGLNVTEDLLNLYIRDYENLNSFKEDSREYQFLSELDLEECEDNSAKQDVIIEALEYYCCYRVSEGNFDLQVADIETGSFSQGQPEEVYTYLMVMHNWNMYQPFFNNKEEVEKTLDENLPYLPNGFEWQKHFGWIEGQEWG